MQYITYTISLLIFYYVGKFSSKDERVLIKDKIKRIRNKVKPGALKFKTPDELEYDMSGEKKVDEAWEDLELNERRV